MNEANTNQRPLVVCLHGSASNSGVWRQLKKLVRDRAVVLAPELSARGRNALTDDAEATMRQVGSARRRFHLVAHGRGCAVAACIATLYPERVKSLVFYEPAGVSRSLARRIDVPLRILCGTRTWRAAKRAAEALVDGIAQANLLKLVGMRHMAPLTHPHIVNAVIVDYVLPVNMPGQARAA